MPEEVAVSRRAKLNEWRDEITALSFGLNLLPHASNLVTKLGLSNATRDRFWESLSRIVPAYIQARTTISNSSQDDFVSTLVGQLNSYIDFIKEPANNVFAHQSDFSSSVIPELFCLLFLGLVEQYEGEYIIQSQANIVIDCKFDPYQNGRILFDTKRVDVSILLQKELTFDGHAVSDFAIPILASEIKTNLDKNMLSGVENSVSSLKKTFPLCIYFVISEFADFATEEQNYANTDIDEIFILRHQKRSDYRRSNQRFSIDVNLVMHIYEKAKERLDMFEHANLEDLELVRRMQNGRLKGGR